LKGIKSYLDGERIRLRKLKFSDANDVYKNVRDKEIVKWTLMIPHPYPKDGARKFIRRTHYSIKKRRAYAFGIEFKGTGNIIGVISIHVNWKDKNGEIGYWLGKKYWNQGLMTEAVQLIKRFGFDQLSLNRIYARLFEENIGSNKLLEKCGFQFEGMLREVYYRYNQWHNELWFGILRREYKK
jgi:RimJ/RimL family protein N-acetyltransferase